jgi:hypothetical protein
MKTVIEMAKEAGLFTHKEVRPELERFAELIRADERQQIIAKNAPEIERINAYIKTLEESVATQERSKK